MNMKNRILFIDDDKQAQDMLSDLLKTDYDYIPLSNQAEVASFFKDSIAPIDLILLDLEKAVQDEFSILKGVRDHYLYRDVPILILTAAASTGNAAQTFTMGADDILSKPLDPAITRQRILNLIHIGKTRRVHNVMEDLIQSEIDKNLDVLGICPCPQCRKDLLTLTLNHSKPRYVSTGKGESIIHAGQLASMDDRIQLLTEITRYANLIKENPRHEA